ncbi:MAG: hypothetical protein KAI71_02560 [Candidatus Pacebacteria bacterium]|nr:hypothetical protein [Candidatus Paceibacterota bacterium]
MKIKKKLTPLKSIRKYCVNSCMNNQQKEVRLCSSTDCPLFPFRFGKRTEKKSSLRAIRKCCLDCTEGSSYTRNCPFTDCPLFPYRTGHNPTRKGIGGNGKQLRIINHSTGSLAKNTRN